MPQFMELLSQSCRDALAKQAIENCSSYFIDVLFALLGLEERVELKALALSRCGEADREEIERLALES